MLLLLADSELSWLPLLLLLILCCVENSMHPSNHPHFLDGYLCSALLANIHLRYMMPAFFPLILNSVFVCSVIKIIVENSSSSEYNNRVPTYGIHVYMNADAVHNHLNTRLWVSFFYFLCSKAFPSIPHPLQCVVFILFAYFAPITPSHSIRSVMFYENVNKHRLRAFAHNRNM